MSTTLIATLGGLWAMLIWGIVDWLFARQSKKVGTLELNATQQIAGVTVIVAIMLATRQHLPSLKNTLIIGATSFFFSVAALFFFRALALGATGVVVPAASTYPLFTLLFSALFVTLSFSHLQILSMLIIIIGIAVLAFERRNKAIPLAVQHRASLFALAAAALWGIGNVIQNSIISQETWPVFLGLIDIWLTIFAFTFLFFDKPRAFINRLKAIPHRQNLLLIGGIYTVGSAGFYYSSIRVGNVIVPLVVSSAAPLVTSAMAAYYDKEKLSIIKRVGAVVAVAGIILLNLN